MRSPGAASAWRSHRSSPRPTARPSSSRAGPASGRPSASPCRSQLAVPDDQLLIEREQLAEPGLRLAALATGQVRSEILDVNLHARAVCGDKLDRHSPLLPHEDGLVALGGQRGLDRMAEALLRLVRILGQHQQPLRWVAALDAAGALPSAREEVRAELAAEAKVAFYLAEPAGKAPGIRERRPHVVGRRLEAILYPYGA